MNLIRDDNTLLDELERISSRPAVPACRTSVTLTLKNRKDYFGHGKFFNMVTGEEIADSANPDTSTDSITTSLDRLGFRIIKRLFDVVGAFLGIILTMPLWLIIIVFIKLDSQGPVFYCQTRVGKNQRRNRRRTSSKDSIGNSRSRERRRDNCYGRTFTLFKFRTMIHDAERESGPVWAKPNDKRITRFGAFLRKMRLDELPQFLNVLSGEMSLVGPRPERPTFVADLTDRIDGYSMRLMVKPGITGLAQVKGGYDSSEATVTRKLSYDLNYIKTWSIWLDIIILFKTVKVVLSGKGAH